jgi:hypothetical protein
MVQTTEDFLQNSGITQYKQAGMLTKNNYWQYFDGLAFVMSIHQAYSMLDKK